VALYFNPVSRAHRLSHRLPNNGSVEESENAQMKAPEISFYEWQQRYKTEAACLKQLAHISFGIMH
jgi:hypothetical protein